MTPSAVVSEKLPLLSSSDTATSHPEAPAEGFLWALSSSAQLSGQQREILRSAQNDTFSCSLRKAPLLSPSDTATCHPEAPAEGSLWALSVSSVQLSGQQREILRFAQNDTFTCTLRKAAVAVILRHSDVSS